MSFTNTSEVDVLNGLLGASNNGTWPDPVFIALSTTAPNEDGTGFTEPVGNGYARVSVSNDGAGWGAAVSGDPSYKPNAATIAFPAATGSWGTITHAGIYTLTSGGVLLNFFTLDVAKPIDNGDTLSFAAGNFKVTQD